ncbi:hypothetical protein ES703_90371 [subsurface metagenome]
MRNAPDASQRILLMRNCNICGLAPDSQIAEKHTKIIKVSDEIMDTAQENNLEIEKAVEKYVEKIKMKMSEALNTG